VKFWNGENGSPKERIWDFGDGTSATWNSPSHTYNVSETKKDTFLVTYIVTYHNWCPDTVSKTIVLQNAPLFNPTYPKDTCVSDSFMVEFNFSGNTSGVKNTFWNFGDGNSTYKIGYVTSTTHAYNSPGVYYLYFRIVYDNYICRETVYDTITVNQAQVDIGDNSVVICNGKPVTLYAGSSYADYLWNDGSTDSNYTPTLPGNYWVKVTDNDGCSATDSISVLIQNPPSNLDLGNDTVICKSNIMVLDAGAGFLSYQWQDNSATQKFTTWLPGTYWVMVTDSCGELHSDTVIIASDSTKLFDLGPDTSFCEGSMINLNVSSGFISYVWRDGASDSVYTISTSGIYWLDATNDSNCTFRDSITVVVHNLPSVNLSNDTAICINQNVTLTSVDNSSIVSYSWNPDSSLSNDTITNPVANPDDTTQYVLTVLDTNGCQNTDSVIINVVKVTPLIVNGGAETICFGDTAKLSANGGTSYIWSPGKSLNDSTIASPVAKPDSTTTFTVTAFDICGSDTANITITVIPQLNILSGSQDTIEKGDSIVLIPLAGEAYSWSPDIGLSCSNCSNPVASPEITTTYYVSITDSNGCTNQDSIIIVVLEKILDSNPPNIFTPNGDGVNDLLFFREISGNGNIKYSLIIFNRWGQAIYQSNDYKNNWDGGILNPDVYYYVLTNTATKAKYHGFIQLIR
ncbi:gliding motility-associated C-terminal domain-containing protein, partial [Sphingobacteriaceae bacterium AH-315-L07]|nr:gliding motility-associated C-terminal domain-containing protein [Sphingobacteriaceae bacterium AH-315-L07]